jgi:hypothetical protein
VNKTSDIPYDEVPPVEDLTLLTYIVQLGEEPLELVAISYIVNILFEDTFD